MDEDAPLGKLEDETVKEITGETYGPLKTLCEQAVALPMSSPATSICPGLFVGPGDRPGLSPERERKVPDAWHQHQHQHQHQS